MSRPDVTSTDRPGLVVSVAFSPQAGQVDEVVIRVDEGATVADAISASGLQARHPTFDLLTLPRGVWGTIRGLDHSLSERDRVEIYRPLQVDPKEARRLRYRAETGSA